MPDSRRSERLFGHQGRTSYRASGVKLEHLQDDYNPTEDTCIKAFVRLIALAAVAATAEDAAAAAEAAAVRSELALEALKTERVGRSLPWRGRLWV